MDIRGMARTVRGKQGREVVQDVLVDVGRAHPDVVIVGADSFRSIRGLGFQAEFPERSFNVGIAEQNAVGIAAGLAISGKLPVVLMFGFTVARALEQIRSSLCYPNLDARIITTATGLDMGEGGATHHCTEDVGLLRTIANMTIIQAASALETVLATRALIEQVHGTAYLRLTRQSYTDEAEDALEEYYAGGRGFEVGRAIVLREGTDVALIGSGLTVGLALQAADMLRERGVHAQVLNVHTIKPLDVATLSEIPQTVGGIVTMEDHNVLGGLGEAVAGVVTRFGSTKVLRIGIDDAFCEIGKPADLCQHHGLCADRVVDRTLDLLAE
jgi:transketolase